MLLIPAQNEQAKVVEEMIDVVCSNLQVYSQKVCTEYQASVS